MPDRGFFGRAWIAVLIAAIGLAGVASLGQPGLPVAADPPAHQPTAWAGSGDPNFEAPPTDPATLQTLMQRLADRYRGRIQAYEYGNEPNTHDFWGKKNPDPAEFARVMAGFYRGKCQNSELSFAAGQ